MVRPLRSSMRLVGALAFAFALVLCGQAQTRAGLIINATYEPGFTPAEIAAINGAVTTLEHDIANSITVNIDFQVMGSGLGESNSNVYSVSYYDYYQALAAVATSPDQLEALASLGAPPLTEASPNPVDGSNQIILTGPIERVLGLNGSQVVGNPGPPYDTIIALNTSITSPPNGLAGYYGLESVAQHELDEALGIGGTGSMLGQGLVGVGDLDLYRYSAPGVRSYTQYETTSPYSYFSINGGATVISYFNQTYGPDYGDWLSNPIPPGFGPQVQDAYGYPGTNPVLGPNELTALNVIGYDLAPVPEPSTVALIASGLFAVGGFWTARRWQRRLVPAAGRRTAC